MKVKVATVHEVELFDHLDLGITRAWRELDTDKMSSDQIEALRTYSDAPKIVMIHPEDAEEFAALDVKRRRPAAK